jgi:Zn-finger nucleic acid-binding protein
MNCPKCPGAALETHRFDTLEIDRCARCGGVWFDAQEQERFYSAKLQLPPPTLSPQEVLALDDKDGACPRCARPMMKVPSKADPAVTLDGCGGCSGTWVDGAELSRGAAGGAGDFGAKMKSLFGDLK